MTGGKLGSAFRAVVDHAPRSLRFLAVGALGLLTDLAVFSAIPAHTTHPLGVRLFSLAVATILTWRLNRALTFERSGRRQSEEAIRYALVTAIAQATSYAVFAVLVLTILGPLPQIAVILGAAVGAIASYNGHRLFAFAPVRNRAPRTQPPPAKSMEALGS